MWVFSLASVVLAAWSSMVTVRGSGPGLYSRYPPAVSDVWPGAARHQAGWPPFDPTAFVRSNPFGGGCSSKVTGSKAAKFAVSPEHHAILSVVLDDLHRRGLAFSDGDPIA